MGNKRHYEVKCRGSEYTVVMGPKRKVTESIEPKRKAMRTMRLKKVNKRLTTESSVVGNHGIEVLIIFDRPLKSTPSTTFDLSLPQKLPSELLQHVFSHLLKRDLAHAALVCRKWGGVAADPRLWNRFTFPLTVTCR